MDTDTEGKSKRRPPPEEIRITEPCPSLLREEGTGSLGKSGFIGVHPWFNRMVSAES